MKAKQEIQGLEEEGRELDLLPGNLGSVRTGGHGQVLCLALWFLLIAPCSAPCSLLPAPCSLLPAPYFLLPAPCSLLHAPFSLLWLLPAWAAISSSALVLDFALDLK